jgi:alpha-L-arabinofuranosidase
VVDGVHAFASVDGDRLLVNLTNPAMTDEAEIEVRFARPVRLERIDRLSADEPTRHNTVAEPDAVRRVGTRLDGPEGTAHTLRLAPGSVNVLHARLA